MEGSSQLANGGGPSIKPDPDLMDVSLAAQSDEDAYEDAGDLDFACANQVVFLTRIPRFLWDNWSKLDAGQELRLGTVRVEGTLDDVKRVRINYSILQSPSDAVMLSILDVDKPTSFFRRCCE